MSTCVVQRDEGLKAQTENPQQCYQTLLLGLKNRSAEIKILRKTCRDYTVSFFIQLLRVVYKSKGNCTKLYSVLWQFKLTMQASTLIVGKKKQIILKLTIDSAGTSVSFSPTGLWTLELHINICLKVFKTESNTTFKSQTS